MNKAEYMTILIHILHTICYYFDYTLTVPSPKEKLQYYNTEHSLDKWQGTNNLRENHSVRPKKNIVCLGQPDLPTKMPRS